MNFLRHAVITAGSKGIGKKVTEQFLDMGCSVTVNYRSDITRVSQLQSEWEPYVNQLHFVQGDITKKADIIKIVREAMDQFGRIDYLINNAGPFIFERKKLVEYDDSEWYEMINGNLNAAFHLLKEIIPIMRKQQFGRIITYGYLDAEHAPGWKYRAAYGAAKSGLVSLTKSVAFEEAENGITANMICPGDIIGTMKEASIETARKTKDDITPIGRSGTGEDISRIIRFLCDENSDLITGSVISASGGIQVVNRYI